ncbi:Ig-like domain-containing protein [Falsiroseomonas sp.]|uniref:Ig-like domain-containing protein n=1 Tax=Falsiroseomonas sp. TaxID=2870721 RepID=UPI00356B4B11
MPVKSRKSTLLVQGAASEEVNGAPVALPDFYCVPAGDILVGLGYGVLANDTDPDGDLLRPLLVSGTSNGALDLDLLGGFSYAPDRGFAGVDSFVYQAFDGELASAPVTVEIEVQRLEVVGTQGYDRLIGTAHAELFRPLGGVVDTLRLGGGMDIIALGDETANGRREITRILDFGADDMLDLGGASIVAWRDTGSWLVLRLDGDGDIVRLKGLDYADLILA